jgi:hypothetical protein
MAEAPKWKIYDSAKVYQCACKELEAAAAVVAFYGNGATIRLSHSWVVWREGHEAQPAAESYDLVAETISRRVAEAHAAMLERRQQFYAKALGLGK